MICGLVLAGGRSRRFGAEKAAALLNGEPLVAIAVAKLQAACDLVAVSATAASATGRWADARGFRRLEDDPALPQGPLTGVLAGLRWAASQGAACLATTPCDTPRLPADLVERLHAALDTDHPAAVARTSDGLHPLCAVWRADLGEIFADALASGRHPPVRDLLARLPAQEVWFDDAEAFVNLNTVEDLQAAQVWSRR